MNCEEIQNLLSEYIDGELAEGERLRLDDHLENCPDCREELAHLREYLNDIGSLRKIKPPADFLKQVHSRLESQSPFKTALKKIAFPIRIKIPLELAGLAAAAVLIIYILNISPENQSDKFIPLAATIRTESDMMKMPEKSGVVQPMPYAKKLKERAAEKRLAPAAPSAYSLMKLDQAAPLPVLNNEIGGERSETVELVLLIEPERYYAQEKSGRGTNLLGMKTKNLQETKAADAGVEGDKIHHTPPLTRLKNLITREGGEIISTEDQTDLIRRLTVQLPPDHYRSFMEKLSGISDLQPERWGRSGDTEQIFRIRLTETIPEN